LQRSARLKGERNPSLLAALCVTHHPHTEASVGTRSSQGSATRLENLTIGPKSRP
jgi:hypothetical protein